MRLFAGHTIEQMKRMRAKHQREIKLAQATVDAIDKELLRRGYTPKPLTVAPKPRPLMAPPPAWPEPEKE